MENQICHASPKLSVVSGKLSYRETFVNFTDLSNENACLI